MWQFFTAIAVTHANILTSVHSTIAHALASLRTERFPTIPLESGILIFGIEL